MAKILHGRSRLILLLLILLIGLALLCRLASRSVFFQAFLGSGSETDVSLPPGFSINVFADGLDGPRFMALGPDGHIYVADRGNNRIVILPDDDGDGVADETMVFAENLNSPHSLAYHDGAWYVGVPSGVVRLQDTDGDGRADETTTIIDDYPSGGHSTRTVAFLPDGRMVVSVGSSCNVCRESDPRRAAIVVYDGPEGGGEMIYASGLRNAVGLAVRPGSGELWASNNGRDLMGDDVPPETIYQVAQGADYGWPGCHSGTVPDPEFGGENACQGVLQPVVQMQAHSAPLGLTFYDGETFPAEYQGDLFVAFHGSWNRTVPTGYKVVRLDFMDGVAANAITDFATGWLEPETETVDGRPVDVTVGADGALYVSDDRAGLIYRIQYTDSQ